MIKLILQGRQPSENVRFIVNAHLPTVHDGTCTIHTRSLGMQFITAYMVMFSTSRTLLYNKQRSQSSYSFLWLFIYDFCLFSTAHVITIRHNYSLIEDIATKAMAVLSNLRDRERLCSEMIRVAATAAIERAIAGSISRLGHARYSTLTTSLTDIGSIE